MHRVCFIDDDKAFEIPLFERVFADTYDIIAADTYDSARKSIAERGDWKPDLFVLDLYFPSGQADTNAVEALRRSTVKYDNDQAEMRAAYGNFRRAESRLRAILDAWKQGPAGGLQIAQRVAADYPQVPIVFYSRKATFKDAVNCMAADGVWWLEKKPTGNNDDETQQLTFAEKPRLVRRFDAIIANEDTQQTLAAKDAARTICQFLSSMREEAGVQ